MKSYSSYNSLFPTYYYHNDDRPVFFELDKNKSYPNIDTNNFQNDIENNECVNTTVYHQNNANSNSHNALNNSDISIGNSNNDTINAKNNNANTINSIDSSNSNSNNSSSSSSNSSSNNNTNNNNTNNNHITYQQITGDTNLITLLKKARSAINNMDRKVFEELRGKTNYFEGLGKGCFLNRLVTVRITCICMLILEYWIYTRLFFMYV